MKNINNWYDCKMGNDHQGLIADEKTGKNIAVCYDKKHTALISACPEMYEALKYVSQWYSDNISIMPVAFQSVVNEIEEIVAKAEGR